MARLLHGHIKIIFLVTLKMLFIFWFVKLATIFCLGQTQDFKQRTAKHKSDVKNPHNSTCVYNSIYIYIYMYVYIYFKQLNKTGKLIIKIHLLTFL